MKTIEGLLEPAAAGKQHKVTVTVDYTGADPYVDDVAPEAELVSVKQKALHAFGIEPSAGGDYALQFAGVNQDDHIKVGDLGTEHVTLTLVRVKPQEKGYAGSDR